MTPSLIATLRGRRHPGDAGLRQTARLIVLAAQEVERLNERIRLLEDELTFLPDDDALEASNRNELRRAAV